MPKIQRLIMTNLNPKHKFKIMQEAVQFNNHFLYVGEHQTFLNLLEEKGINVCAMPSFEEALNELKVHNFDALIINNHHNFNELSARLKINELPKIPVYLLSENEPKDRLFQAKSTEKIKDFIIVDKREKGIYTLMNYINEDVKKRKNNPDVLLFDYQNKEVVAPYLSVEIMDNNNKFQTTKKISD